MKVIILYIKNKFIEKPFHGSLNNFGHEGKVATTLCNQI